MRKLLAIGVSLAMASGAMAGFTVTDAGPHDSNGPVGDPANGVFTYNYTGADFAVGDLIFEGDVTSGGIGSYLSELRIQITDPLGSAAYFAPGSGTTWVGTQHIGPLTVTGGGAFWTGTAGNWEFRFYESFDDGGTGAVDATWTNLSFDFLDAPPPPQYIWIEEFEAGIPGDWTLVDNTGNGGWGLNTDFGRPNYTGGTGNAAAVDSDFYGFAAIDAELITHTFSVPVGGALDFDHDFNWYSGGGSEVGDVDIWTSALGWTNLASYSGGDFNGHVSIPLTAYEGENVQVRFHYYNANFDWWWQVDNVGVTPEPASLLLVAVGALALARRR